MIPGPRRATLSRRLGCPAGARRDRAAGWAAAGTGTTQAGRAGPGGGPGSPPGRSEAPGQSHGPSRCHGGCRGGRRVGVGSLAVRGRDS